LKERDDVLIPGVENVSDGLGLCLHGSIRFKVDLPRQQGRQDAPDVLSKVRATTVQNIFPMALCFIRSL
jgi:hypothetical protein